MAEAPPSRTFTVTPVAGQLLEIRLSFDARAIFGHARPPVHVIIDGYTYHSTVAIMGGVAFVPLRRSHGEAADVIKGQPVAVTLTLDPDPRTIEALHDLKAALQAVGIWTRWEALAFTHQREHVEAVEGAKKPETRARRIVKCVAMVASK